MSTTDPLDDPDLTPLVSQALELRDQGIEPQLELICENRPDLIAAVRDSVRASEMLPMLQHASSTHDSYSGQVLAQRYRLEERLGSGAMGVVYRGHDQDLDRAVAVKILRLGLLGGDEAEFRFQREAEVLAAIDHHAVVRVYDRGRTDQDDPFLVMELLDGMPLSQILDQGKGDGITTHSNDTAWVARQLGVSTLDETSYLRAACRWTADLASGLEAAHESEIYHRDIKPSNVVLRRDGRPVLLDFGIAARASQKTYTRDGAPLGTPAYMAPESLSEGHRANPRQDVYGLTATLYHLLTLRAPYSGNPSQVITTLLTKEAPVASSLRPGLPRDLQAILDKGMARRPEDRYANAVELESDLRSFLDYRPVRARHIPGWYRGWRRLRRSPAFKAAAIVLLLVTTVFGSIEARAAMRENQQAKRDDVWEHVLPNLGVGSAPFRTVSEDAGHAEVAATLDRAVELSVEALPDRLIRANFRLDHGDPAGAAADLAAIADEEGSAYLRALAERYAALPEDAVGSAALDQAELPAPDGPMDHYVAGVHAIRDGDYPRAFELLRAPGLEEYAPAHELLFFDPWIKKDRQAAYEQAVFYEQLLPRRSATSAHRIATSLAAMGQDGRAIPIFEEGLELAPLSPHLHENLGLSLYMVLRVEEAAEHLERAIELQPLLLKPHTNLVRVHCASEDFEAARRVAAAAPYGEGGKADYLRWMWQGRVETEEAVHLRDLGEEEAALEAAQRALGFYTQVEALTRKTSTDGHAMIAKAFVGADPEPVFAGLLAVLEKDPLHQRIFQILPDWMPTELDDEQTQQLSGVLKLVAAEVEILKRSQELSSPTPESNE